MTAFVASYGRFRPEHQLISKSTSAIKHRSRTATLASMEDVDISPRRDTNQVNMLSIISHSLSDVLNPPPAPVVLARKTLDKDFAVLLMRTGYNVVDDLDFVPMDVFQAQFFEIRSSEWERFIQNNLGMRQGIITDPRYFDFISYAQMLTIQFFMREPRIVFQERYGDENGNFGTRVVRRDLDRLGTPKDILDAWRLDVGRRIYQRLLDTVRRPQPAPSGDVEAVVHGIASIYDYLEIAGFCLQIKLSREGKGMAVVRVEMIAPCILWGSKALRRRRSIPNDYDCFAVEAFCNSSGTYAKYSTLFSKSSVTRLWTIA